MLTKLNTRVLMLVTAVGIFVVLGCSATKNISESNFHYFDRGLHYVSQFIDGNRRIMLEDRSLWEVDIFDSFDARLWQLTDEIRVEQNFGGDNPDYPYILINLRRGDAVDVKLVSEV